MSTKHDDRTEWRKQQAKARQQIVDAANRLSLHLNLGPPTYSQRRIQQAVAVVRRRRLVKPLVLVAAGFNPGRLS